MATLRDVVHGLHQGVLCVQNVVGFTIRATYNYVYVWWKQTAGPVPIYA